jgi:AbrB family looped-hinge helix DNA binding protein
MHKAKLTSKGQITLPVEVRNAMRLKAGEKVAFFEGPDGEFMIRRVGSILELEGCLAGLDLPRTDEEMNELLHRRAVELDEATKSSAREASDSEAA